MFWVNNFECVYPVKKLTSKIFQITVRTCTCMYRSNSTLPFCNPTCTCMCSNSVVKKNLAVYWWCWVQIFDLGWSSFLIVPSITDQISLGLQLSLCQDSRLMPEGGVSCRDIIYMTYASKLLWCEEHIVLCSVPFILYLLNYTAQYAHVCIGVNHARITG